MSRIRGRVPVHPPIIYTFGRKMVPVVRESWVASWSVSQASL